MAKKKLKAHLDLQQNELQNAKGHNLNATPNDVVESQFWYDTVSKRFKYYNGTAAKDFGKEYTASTGINITGEAISIDTTVVAQKSDLPTKVSDLTNDAGYTTNTGTVTSVNNVSPNSSGNVTLDNFTDFSIKEKATGAYDIYFESLTFDGYPTLDLYEKSQPSSSSKENLNLSINGTKIYDAGTSKINDNVISSNIARTSDIPDAQIQSDWSQTDNTKKDYIKNKPTIPTVNNATLTIQKNGTTVDTFTANASSNKTVNITVPTTVSELTDSSNYALKTDLNKVYKASGTVASASALPTLSASVLGNVYNVTTAFNTTSDFVEGSGKQIQVGNDIVVVNIGTDASPTYKFSVMGDFVDISGKQDVIDSSHKLSSDLVDDTGHTNKFVTASDKTTWNGKQDAIDSSHKLSSDLVDDTNKTNKFVTASDKTNWNGACTTIAGYGNIVTHNASEFATAAQGAKADTALQSITKQQVVDALTFLPTNTLSFLNPALTQSGGEVSWQLWTSSNCRFKNGDLNIDVYEKVNNTWVSTETENIIDVSTTTPIVTIKMNSSSNISANTYKAVVTGKTATAVESA